MTIILEPYPIPDTGTFEIRQTVTVNLSAAEARRKVQRWLLLEVSHMMGADEPVLVVGQRTVWRVPAHLSAPHVGVVGEVGVIEVDATTGEVLNLSSQQVAIEQRAGKLMTTLPPFQPYTSVPEACQPRQVPRAPRLVLSDTDEPTLLSTNAN